MAVSAFYIHRRTVDHVLDRLIAIRRRRGDPAAAVSDDEETGVDDEEEEDGDDVASGWQISRSYDDEIDFIPSGLQPLHTTREDGQEPCTNSFSSKFRVGSYGKLMTPRSSGGYAVGSGRNSDDEETETAIEEDAGFDYEDVDSSACYMNSNDSNLNIQSVSAPSFKGEIRSCFLDQQVRGERVPNESNGSSIQYGDAGATSMGLVANESKNLPLRPTSNESVYKEELEVWEMLRECLELREKYVFREKIAPWVKATGEESRASFRNTDPLCFVPVEKTVHHFRMEDGVVRVYGSENDSTELFPVASSTAFFTDMHHLLKVMSIGDVQSTCHLRLRFLEEIRSFLLRRVRPIVIFTILEKLIHTCIILLA